MDPSVERTKRGWAAPISLLLLPLAVLVSACGSGAGTDGEGAADTQPEPPRQVEPRAPAPDPSGPGGPSAEGEDVFQGVQGPDRDPVVPDPAGALATDSAFAVATDFPVSPDSAVAAGNPPATRDAEEAAAPVRREDLRPPTRPLAASLTTARIEAAVREAGLVIPDRYLQTDLPLPQATPVRPLLSGAGPAALLKSDADSPISSALIPGTPAAPQEALLNLQFGRLTETTVQAFADGTVALLPAFALLQLAEIDVRRGSQGAIRATLHPDEVPLYLSGDSALAWVGDEPVEVPAGSIRAVGGELFVATPVLERLLDVTIRTDWISLTSTILDPENLPLAQRLRREARWARLRGGQLSSRQAPLLELQSSKIGGAVLDWSVSNNARSPEESLDYSTALGARLFDGSLRFSSRSVGAAALRQNHYDVTYERVFQNSSWLTQLRLGDGFTTGPRFRSFRGISLTNAPYLRDGMFSTETFSSRVGPGWDVELRQSGRTLDLTRADEQGAFALDIPLRYGENTLQVVAFGPHGEVITTDRVFLAGSELIPGGAFEWGASAGECRDRRCDATGNLDLRYGVSDRLTLRGGAEGFTRQDGSAVIQPYMQASGLILPSLQLSVEALRAGFLRGGATFSPSPWLRARGAYTAFSSELANPILHDASRRSTIEGDIFFRPDPSNPRLFLRGAYLGQELNDVDLTRIQASATVPVGGMNVEGGIRRLTDTPVGLSSTAEDYQFGAVFGNIRIGEKQRFFVRGEVEVLKAELMNRLRGQVSYQINNAFRVNLTAGWQKRFGTTLSLTFNAFRPQFRSAVQMNASEEGPAQIAQFTQGTVYWNEATKDVDFAPGPGIQRGGLSGYVFLDENGNGIRDPREEGLEGVRLVVGGRPVVTDAQGRHTSWDLVPYREVEVWADSTSIQDPTLVPKQSRVRVDVPPSSVGRLDVPVTISRQITGEVVQVQEPGAEEGLPLPYAKLELANQETGEVREFRAFSDGQFYEAAVRPGVYELRLARDYMIQSGLTPEGSWPTVVVGGENPFQIIGPISVRVVRLPDQGLDDGWIEGGQADGTNNGMNRSGPSRPDGKASGGGGTELENPSGTGSAASAGPEATTDPGLSSGEAGSGRPGPGGTP